MDRKFILFFYNMGLNKGYGEGLDCGLRYGFWVGVFTILLAMCFMIICQELGVF